MHYCILHAEDPSETDVGSDPILGVQETISCGKRVKYCEPQIGYIDENCICSELESGSERRAYRSPMKSVREGSSVWPVSLR